MPKLTLAKVFGVLLCLDALGISGLLVEGSLGSGPEAAVLAASLGLSVAGLALAVFIHPEEAARKRAERAWECKLALEEAAHQYATLVKLTEELGASPREFVYYGLQRLSRALESALTSGLYTALGSLEQEERVAEEDQVFQILLILHCDIAKALEHCEEPRECLWSNGIYLAVSSLYPRLAHLTKDRLIQHIDGKLSAKPMEHLFKLSQSEQMLGFARQIAVHLSQKNRCGQPLSLMDLADICQEARIRLPRLAPHAQNMESRARLVGKTLEYLFERAKPRKEVELRLPGGDTCKLVQRPAPNNSETGNPETAKLYTFILSSPPLEITPGTGEAVERN